jgi:hypothetical protein
MRIRFYIVIFTIGWIASIATAEAPKKSFELVGAVQDSSGAVIVGAKVTVAGPDGTIVTQGVTDNAGNFRFVQVSTGNYTIDVTQTGFQEVKQSIKVGPGLPQQMRIVLPVSSVNEQVIVGAPDNSAAQVSTEISQNQNANSVDRDALDRLPVFDQDYITTLSRFLDSDATGTNGITLVVNGAEANGPGVTASAIQSVKINQNPYTALYSRPGRARIDITTKGGTPRLHGSANFLYRDSLFDARNTFAITKPSEQRTYYEGSLTGPLSHNKKTTFLLALDRDNDNQQAIVLAAGANGTINANVPNPTRHYFLSGRVFHDYGQGNQFWVGYSYDIRQWEILEWGDRSSRSGHEYSLLRARNQCWGCLRVLAEATEPASFPGRSLR